MGIWTVKDLSNLSDGRKLCRRRVEMMEYLSTAKVGGDPNAVSEVLHRDPYCHGLAQKDLQAARRIRMRRREAYRSELLSGGKARQIPVCDCPGDSAALHSVSASACACRHCTFLCIVEYVVVTENSVRAGNAKILSACRHSLP